MKKLLYLSLSSLLLTTFGCTKPSTVSEGVFSPATQTVLSDSSAIPHRVELEQGWDSETRMKFWFTTQGSQIIPYSWFTWLEQADNETLFRHPDHMESLRYLPMPPSSENPSGLPIGFALNKDKTSNKSWVGLTCSACHTNQIDYQDKKILVEGAPTLANFVLFFEKLIDALNQTQMDEQKFNRFARNVLDSNYSASTADELREAMKIVTLSLAQRQEVNKLPDDYPKDFTSYARLDAFGNIQNAGSAFALHDLNNKNAPTGPVSYPFLWGTHQSDVVQWNASAPNTPVIGPLARNVGEVVGVFGSLSIDKAPWWERLIGINNTYSSTVNLSNLGKLEAWVKDLRSPVWPDEYLPPIDTIKAAKGSLIYGEQCASCHQVIPRKDEGLKYTSIKTPLNEVKTDSAMAWNAAHHCSKTLALAGEKDHILFGDKFKEVDSSLAIAVNGATALVLRRPITSIRAGLRSDKRRTKKVGSMPSESQAPAEEQDISASDIEEYVKQHNEARKANNINTDVCIKDKNNLEGLVYKARPLNGIWATAPYLHNGSVANLTELLKAPSERATTFWVGSREFDPVNVGFVTHEGLSEFRVLDSAGNIQRGNSNRGHDYGTNNLSDIDKENLVEYMKTL